MSTRLDAWNSYVDLVNRQRDELGAIAFDANDKTYTPLMAGFYLGYDAGALKTVEFYETMQHNIAMMSDRSLTMPLGEGK